MESDSNSFVSIVLPGLIGLLGVLASIPLNALFAWYLKRDEQKYQLKLDTILELRKRIISQTEKRDKDVVSLQKDVDHLKKAVQEIWRRF